MTPGNSPHSDQESTDPREALVDAMLREHARLGTGNDESLLASIRARTVEKPAPARVVEMSPVDSPPRPKARVSAREWLQVAAVVALFVVGTGFFLSRQSAPQVTRTEQTFQLVSRPMASVTVASAERNPVVRSATPSDPKLGEFSLPNLASTELGPSGSMAFPDVTGADPVNQELLAEFSVSAEKILRTDEGRLVYEGDVVLRHPDFTLEADRLEMAAKSDETGSRVDDFVARGEDLRIQKRSPNGALEIAHAESATWDADGARIILAGSPSLTAGSSFVRPYTSAGQIVLRPDGYEVIER